jgi:hypothetical protein
VTAGGALESVRKLWTQLRQRGFELSPTDLDALRLALLAGFGWDSRDSFRELLVALWAKTPREAQALRALFERLNWPEGWTAPTPAVLISAPRVPRLAVVDPQPVDTAPVPTLGAAPGAIAADTKEPRLARVAAGLPPWPTADVRFADARLIDVEMFPLNHREVAQAFRRLRRPARIGPPTELDVDATVAMRSRRGVATPPVMVPRRGNNAHLVVFVDVAAPMRPYKPFVDMVCDAVLQAGLLRRAMRLFFHELPSSVAGRALLDELPVDGFAPVLDPLLARIAPTDSGELYLDEMLEQPVALPELLRSLEPSTAALVISDVDAARGSFDLLRLHDTLAFARALRQHGVSIAWLNPLPRALWARSTAAQLARHVPMYSLDRTGVLRAVNAMRGQPVELERAL